MYSKRTMTDKKMKIEFAPGAFDNFEGTQDELDQLMNELNTMIEDGSFLDESEPVDLATLFEEDPELALLIANQMGLFADLVDGDGNEITWELLQEVADEERKRKLN